MPPDDARGSQNDKCGDLQNVKNRTWYFRGSQVGYIVLDPETGGGAYLIGGGENGGEIDFSVIIDFIGSFLSDLPNELASHFGKMISRVKQVFDFSVDAKDWALGLLRLNLLPSWP